MCEKNAGYVLKIVLTSQLGLGSVKCFIVWVFSLLLPMGLVHPRVSGMGSWQRSDLRIYSPLPKKWNTYTH